MKPTTRLFIGGSLSGHEARFLRDLYADFAPVGALLLANFHAGPRQIDFLVVTDSLAAILELKHLPQPVFGRRNGPWMVENPSGKRVPYPGPNPWEQTLQQKYALSDEMRRYTSAASDVHPPRRFYAEFEAYVCIVPRIHPQSKVIRKDHKVSVLSYSEVLEAFRNRSGSTVWNRAEWTRFATDHLLLTPATLQEAIDSKVHAAANSVRSYLSRIEPVVGFQLPPLLPPAAGCNRGQVLIDSLLAGKNHLMLGPSGSAKTFHLRHAAIAAARKGTEVPVLVEAKTYRGGSFWNLVRRGTGPMFTGNPQQLLDSVRACALHPLLLVDAVNECPVEHRAELLRGVQTFSLHFGARVVFTSQQVVDLPEDLPSVVTRLAMPSREDKRFIYCYHASIERSPEVDYLCEGFTNAYDLAVAGRCHASGVTPSSRAQLFDRYVQTCLPQDYHVGTALLRAISSQMAATVSSSWERREYESFAERFLAHAGGPLETLDRLSRCPLVRVTDDAFSFEHELLADYFNAIETYHRHGASPELVAELGKPRNQRLIELILPWLSDEDRIGQVLAASTDSALLSRVLAGRCGPPARASLVRDIAALFDMATRDVANLTCKCHLVQLDDGRRRLDGVSLEGTRSWGSYCGRLCLLIAYHLDHPVITASFLKLLEATESALRQVSEQAAKDHRLNPRVVWAELVRTYGGVLESSSMQLPCSAILAKLRLPLMDRKYPDVSPIWQPLLDRAATIPGSHFALLALFEHRQRSTAFDLETILDLVRRGWESEIYILKVKALEFLDSLRPELSDGAALLIRDMLQTFETNDILESTFLLETLTAYGGLKPPVTSADALSEMRATIAPNARTDSTVVEAAQAIGTDARAFLAGRANGCLGRMFEPVFQGAYDVAYEALSRHEKSAILALALECPDCHFHSAWLLRELLEQGSNEVLPTYQQYAAAIDSDSSSAQESTTAFLLAMQGCAHFMEEPPAYTGGETPPHRAWAMMGKIFFWTYRKNDVARALWSQFDAPTRLAAADVLYNVAHCSWHLGASRQPVDLVALYPNEVRALVADCLRERESLPTVFNYGGSRDRNVLSYLIDVLGRVGNETSARFLQSLIDDVELGKYAITAIHSIRKANTHRMP